jgi:LysR family transcriptional regulator, cell division regulator
MPRMDAGDLRIFEAVARTGAINRAAAELNTVQSNVTARIRHLEEELGTSLFHRHSRGVTLTPAGQRLLPYAMRSAQLFAEARHAVLDDGTPKGPLAVGSLETTAALRLAPILWRFAQSHPDVDMTLKTGTSAELVDLVLERRLEGAFVCGPVNHPELIEEVVFREELVVVTAPSVASLDTLFAQREVKSVVLRLGCSYRQRLETVFAERGIVGLRWLEFGTIDGIVACVAAGIGISMLPRALLEPAQREGRVALHALPSNEAIVDTVLVRRIDGYETSALRAFLDLVRAGAKTGARIRAAE